MTQKIFFNGEICNVSDAKINPTDSGFLYGAGLFETMRCKDCVIFAIEDHIDRLFYSAESLELKLAGGKDYFIDAIYKTIEANGLKDARVRLTISSGPLSAEEPVPTTLVTAAEFSPYPKEYYEKGVIVTLSQARQNPIDHLTGHKTTSYFSRLISLSDAHKKGAAEALWFTVDGKLAEGCVSNVFIVKDSVIQTPLIKTPILPGIARKRIFDIAGENSIEIQEKDITIDELIAADEVFLTNVIMQVMPVVQVEAHKIAQNRPSEIASKMMKLFADCVDDYCIKNSRD